MQLSYTTGSLHCGQTPFLSHWLINGNPPINDKPWLIGLRRTNPWLLGLREDNSVIVPSTSRTNGQFFSLLGEQSVQLTPHDEYWVLIDSLSYSTSLGIFVFLSKKTLCKFLPPQAWLISDYPFKKTLIVIIFLSTIRVFLCHNILL